LVAEELSAEPIPRTRTHHQVVMRLCEMIREGRLRSGERLPSERDLAEQLQVGRSTVREALRVLEVSGIVALRHGSGAYLRDIREHDVISPLALLLDASGDGDIVGELWEVRIMFEPPLAARAALRATDEEIAALGRMVIDHERLFTAPDTLEVCLAADREFHVRIAQAARNQVAVRVVQLLKQVLHESRRHFSASGERRWQAYESHREIMRAIREREPHAAYDCMLRHLQDVEAHIVGQLLHSQPATMDASLQALVGARSE
jgi:GntR family transcriptional regulator, transcriptional repressor for pyruvate dehydrogenase complex